MTQRTKTPHAAQTLRDELQRRDELRGALDYKAAIQKAIDKRRAG